MFALISYFNSEVFLVSKLETRLEGKFRDTLDSYNTLVLKN